MYNVTLINLAADARSAAGSLVTIERTGLTAAELRVLLQSFCDLDAVENALAEPEIRVKVRNESYLIRTGQKKLMLYDVLRRDLPALVLTLDEVMAELDGSGQAARSAQLTPNQQPVSESSVPPAPPVQPVAPASRLRLLVLGIVAVLLLGAAVGLQLGRKLPAAPASFRPLARTEAADLEAALAGVYLTGNQPGQHGIVIVTVGAMKLFELRAVAAPRIVYLSAVPGRVGAKLALATDQPGGLIEVPDHDTLVYCGEVYRRIP